MLLKRKPFEVHYDKIKKAISKFGIPKLIVIDKERYNLLNIMVLHNNAKNKSLFIINNEAQIRMNVADSGFYLIDNIPITYKITDKTRKQFNIDIIGFTSFIDFWLSILDKHDYCYLIYNDKCKRLKLS